MRHLALLVFLATPAMAEEFTLPPLDTFRATVERPLFTPGRRAPYTEPVVAEPVAELAPVWRLVGFIVDGSGRGAALVRDEGAGQVIRVRPGEMIGSWMIQRIAAGEVTLVRGEEQVSVPLDGDIPE